VFNHATSRAVLPDHGTLRGLRRTLAIWVRGLQTTCAACNSRASRRSYYSPAYTIDAIARSKACKRWISSTRRDRHVGAQHGRNLVLRAMLIDRHQGRCDLGGAVYSYDDFVKYRTRTLPRADAQRWRRGRPAAAGARNREARQPDTPSRIEGGVAHRDIDRPKSPCFTRSVNDSVSTSLFARPAQVLVADIKVYGLRVRGGGTTSTRLLRNAMERPVVFFKKHL